VGFAVGTAVGFAVGAAVGAVVGAAVGTDVGTVVGAAVGTAVGAAVGFTVGTGVFAKGQGAALLEGLSIIGIYVLPLLDTEAGRDDFWVVLPLSPAVLFGTGVAFVLQGGVFTMYQPE